MKITKSGKKDIAILIVLLLITQIIPFELLPLKAIAAAGENKTIFMTPNGDITDNIEYDTITFKTFDSAVDQPEEGKDASSYSLGGVTIQSGVTVKARVINIYTYSVEPWDHRYDTCTFLNVFGTLEADVINVYGWVELEGEGVINAKQINMYGDSVIEGGSNTEINGDIYIDNCNTFRNEGIVNGNVVVGSSEKEYEDSIYFENLSYINGTVTFNAISEVVGVNEVGIPTANGYIVNASLADGGVLYLRDMNTYIENNTDDNILGSIFATNYEFEVLPHTKAIIYPTQTEIANSEDFGKNTLKKLKKETKTVSYTNDSVMELRYIISKNENTAFEIKIEENEEIGVEEEEGKTVVYIPSGETLNLDFTIKDSFDKLGDISESFDVEVLLPDFYYVYDQNPEYQKVTAATGKIILSANVMDKLEKPENPYSLSGTKGTNADFLKEYGQDYYTTDVTLTPAKGYQVASKADGSNARESLIYKVKTEDVVIYLVDEDGDMTDAIEVGTIIPNVEEPKEEVVEEKKEEVKEETKEEEKEEDGLKSGSGTVTVSKCYYGGSYEVKTSSSTNDASKATIKYKSKVTGFYLPGAPSGVGDYVVEATFPGNDKYESYVATCDFSIEYLPVPTTPYSIKGKVGNNDFYVTDVSIKPLEGYLISDSLNGTYSESIDITETKNIRYVYLKKADTGEMTDSIPVNNIKMDKVQPSISGVVANKEYFSDSFEFDVSDDNLSKVLLDGKEVKFDGKKCVINVDPDGDSKIYRLETIDQAGNQNTISFTVSAAWLQNKVIIPDKFIKLKGGDTYTLPEGKWKIEYEDGTTDPNVYLGGYKVTLESDARMKFTLN